MSLFDLFSKRGRPVPEVFQFDELSKKLRNQIFWILKGTFLEDRSHPKNEFENSWTEFICRTLCSEHGLLSLQANSQSLQQQYLGTLLDSNDTMLVLDLIEISCRVLIEEAGGYPSQRNWQEAHARSAIESLNYRFRENGTGYQFNYDARQIIRLDNLVIHQSAISPAIRLLHNPQYASAEEEFLKALDDYKRSDFDDCVVKCCSAMESVLKITHQIKKWAFNPNDTAAPLVKSLVSHAGLDSFFEQPLMLIATIRNRLGTAHGAGTTSKSVPQHIALYSINATASAILLIVEAA